MTKRILLLTAALLPLAATLPAAAPLAAQCAATDLFAYANGGRVVVAPEGTDFAQMSATPLNLIDDSNKTDWEFEGHNAVVVVELAERTELSRIAFDTAFLNKDGKAPRNITVEISDTGPDAGFQPVLTATLRKADNQAFAFKPEARPTGRWVRLTILSNSGEDYTGITGFRGYGTQLTQEASIPTDLTGTWEGASGWGKIRLQQQGDQVSGCYSYQSGRFTGKIVGRVLKLDMRDTDSSGDVTPLYGNFSVSPDGDQIIGLVREPIPSARESYANYYSAERVSRKGDGC